MRAADVVGARSDLGGNPFTLGVASGDPTPHGVLLWSRLAPRPLEPGGGMSPEPVAVRWELAEDENFTKLLKSGKTHATPQLGHSIHVPVSKVATFAVESGRPGAQRV